MLKILKKLSFKCSIGINLSELMLLCGSYSSSNNKRIEWESKKLP